MWQTNLLPGRAAAQLLKPETPSCPSIFRAAVGGAIISVKTNNTTRPEALGQGKKLVLADRDCGNFLSNPSCLCRAVSKESGKRVGFETPPSS